jgi:hypothetical protein
MEIVRDEAAPKRAAAIDYAGILFALTAALALAGPLAAAVFPAMVDLPNHWARQAIVHALDTSSFYRDYFEYRWALNANLGMDLFVQGTADALGVDAAVRVWIFLAAFSPWFGIVFLGWALHRQLLGPALWGALFVYNAPFQYGFVNYTFGLGLAFAFYGLWLLARTGSFWLRTLGFAVLATVLLAQHFAAFGVYAVLVAAHETTQRLIAWRAGGRFPDRHAWIEAGRDAAIVAFQFIAALAAFFAFSPTAERVDAFMYSSWANKLRWLGTPLIFNDPPLETVLAAAAALALAAAWRWRLIALRIDQAPGFFILVLAYLILPHCALGSCLADYRLPTAIAFFGLACFRFGDAASPRRRAAFITAMLAVLLVRQADIARAWSANDARIGELRAALSALPRGAHVLVATGGVARGFVERDPLPIHWAVMGMAWNEIYVPMLFGAQHGSQSIHYRRPEDEKLNPTVAEALPQFACKGYDHMLVFSPETFAMPAAFQAERIAGGAVFALFRITSQRCPTPRSAPS